MSRGSFSRIYVLPSSGKGEVPPRLRAVVPPPATAETDSGVTKIRGSGASVVDLRHSYSANYSRTVMKESERTYDKVRIKNPDDSSQHVDVKRPKKVKHQQPRSYFPSDAQIAAVSARYFAACGPTYMTIFYAPEKEDDTTEILEKNIKERNPNYNG